MSSYRTLVDHAACNTLSAGGSDTSLAIAAATASPTALHRMIKYWRNSSGKIPGLRKSESFADYRRHSGSGSGEGGGHGTLPHHRQVAQYQRLESYDESKLQAQMR
ncbi:hypothetical protein KR044_001650 [Drosophila immigrans]|nr:hypothetical protein KR044_001650 [Drosophila immigrans]